VCLLAVVAQVQGAGQSATNAGQPPAAQAGHQAEPGNPSRADAQAQAGHGEGAGTEHGTEAHGESTFSFLSRIANFLILVGGLYYLLRSTVGRYLEARAQQIQSNLLTAAETRREATRHMSEIEARLAALPGEVDALRLRGKEEVAAEQERIRQAAEAERQRLVEQARREIGRQLQIARRELTEHAADLAVGVARTRLQRELSGEQQIRLIDRYVSQVETHHE
jgi:F-type H+-transporting ATPase subunit b